MAAGLYFHIPFCFAKCPYCDFYSVPYDETTAKKYADAAIKQLTSGAQKEIDTVYFGGGTPSFLPINELKRLINHTFSHHFVADATEITLEMNPADCGRGYLDELLELGVNRLSIGIQSLDDDNLSILKRRHNAQTAIRAATDARRAGFTNISADMMTALPAMTPEKAREEVLRFSELPIDHLSMYMLKICENTPFYKNPPPNLPDDDQSAEIYLSAYETLCECGFERYEISNFTNRNKYSKHNLKYWSCEDYIGIGPSAHSCIDGIRTSVPASLGDYIRDPLITRREGTLDAADYMICSLRTKWGLSEKILEERFSYSFDTDKGNQLDELRRAGLLTREDGVIRLTDSGFLVENSVLARLI